MTVVPPNLAGISSPLMPTAFLAIGCACNTAPVSQTTTFSGSPGKLERELHLASIGRGFQSMPQLPCQFLVRLLSSVFADHFLCTNYR
ncbi:MAG: hypothetical protein ABFD58_06790 [Anaerolineaceae bacterium]